MATYLCKPETRKYLVKGKWASTKLFCSSAILIHGLLALLQLIPYARFLPAFFSYQSRLIVLHKNYYSNKYVFESIKRFRIYTSTFRKSNLQRINFRKCPRLAVQYYKAALSSTSATDKRIYACIISRLAGRVYANKKDHVLVSLSHWCEREQGCDYAQARTLPCVRVCVRPRIVELLSSSLDGQGRSHWGGQGGKSRDRQREGRAVRVCVVYV